MIRILFLIFGLTVWAEIAGAAPVTVRSGEHDGFTRLVMQLPDGAGWALETSGRQAVLDLHLADVTFDTGEVFQRIARKRVQGLTQSAPGQPLTIALGCDCEVTRFVQAGNWLVIDIADPPAGTRPPTRDRWLDRSAYRFAQLHGVAPGKGSFALAVARPVSPPPAPAAEAFAALPVAPEINLSEQRLLEQIARGADQGLLTLVDSRSPAAAPAPAEAAEAGTVHARQGPSSARPSRIAVTAVTSVDRDYDGVGRDGRPAGFDPTCLDDAAVDVSAWGDDAPFHVQLSDARGRLTGEFDQVQPDAVGALARLYVHFGFGAEAIRTLHLTDRPVEGAAIIAALAGIIEPLGQASSGPFDGQQGCDGAVALWSYLAAPEGDGAPGANVGAILRTFAALPRHLRAQLGPALSLRLGHDGEISAADQVLRIADRAETAAPEVNLARAQIENARGKTEAAVRHLAEATETDSPAVPEALIELTETLWRSGRAPDPDLPERIAAFRTEFRRTVHGPGLYRAHVLSLAMLGRFVEAFDLASAAPDAVTASLQPQLAADLMALLTERGSDIDFLRFGLGATMARSGNAAPGQQGGAIPGTYPAALRAAMARRFLALGFPRQATEILAGTEGATGSDQGSDSRILRARAALAEDLPHRAMVELLRLSGPEADALRAEALTRTGDLAGAAQLYVEAGDPGAASRLFWRAGDWVALPGDGDPRYLAAADLSAALTEPPAPPDPDRPLAAARSLLDGSVEMRQRIDALFDLVTGPDPGNGA